MLLSRSKDSCLGWHWLTPESCTVFWEVDAAVEEYLSTLDTDESLFWLEGVGRALVLFSYLFDTCPSGFYISQLCSNNARVANEILSPKYRRVGIEDPLLPNGIASEGSIGEILLVDRRSHFWRLMSPIQTCSFRIHVDLPRQSCNYPCLVVRAIVGETSDRSCEVEGY